MESDRSSRVAARRIVEEVLAEHAARATPLDGVNPVTIVERPDTPSWRAARRIVEETLAEHAARAVIPEAVQLDVVVDLVERDIEVVVDLDGGAPATETDTRQAVTSERSEPSVASVVAPIERDETPAQAARRVVEGVLAEQEIDPDAPPDPRDAPMAFEVDPVPRALPDPPEAITARVDGEVEPSETVDPGDAGPTGAESNEDEPAETDESPASDEVDGEVVPVEDARLRAAIPERLFAPDPESTDADMPLDEPSAVDVPVVAPAVDGPPSPPTPAVVPSEPLDPDAPVAIAARIVADVMADRERAAQEASDAALAALEAEVDGSEERPEEAAAHAPESDTGPAASEGPEARPIGPPEGWVGMPGATERIGPASPSGVMTVAAEVEEPLVLDPAGSDPDIDDLPVDATDAFWDGQERVAPETEDEFGGWPEPIAPSRRTGRWLITTVLGAVLLALLLPLAIGALRDLLSFS